MPPFTAFYILCAVGIIVTVFVLLPHSKDVGEAITEIAQEIKDTLSNDEQEETENE